MGSLGRTHNGEALELLHHTGFRQGEHSCSLSLAEMQNGGTRMTAAPHAGAQQSHYLPHAVCKALARAAGASARLWVHTCSSSGPSASTCSKEKESSGAADGLFAKQSAGRHASPLLTVPAGSQPLLAAPTVQPQPILSSLDAAPQLELKECRLELKQGLAVLGDEAMLSEGPPWPQKAQFCPESAQQSNIHWRSSEQD